MELSTEEKNQLLNLMKDRYGYDFTNYAEASIKRRIVRFCDLKGIDSFFDLRHLILNDPGLFADFILQVTVNVTEMFRDAHFFQALREKVFPALATYPYARIWHAGCSTGEEVYSMAICLKESGMKKTTIYATDINTQALSEARDGAYPIKIMKEYTANYLKAGGTHSFSDYYTARYNMAIFNASLKKNIVFSQHNLVSDGSFNEFNLIVCRNVIIYFNRQLQDRVIGLFYDSLPPLGYLALGPKESLLFSAYKNKFQIIDKEAKIYRRLE